MLPDETYLETLVLGGAVLGAGGGGTIAAGLTAGRQALTMGAPSLVDLDTLPDDAILVTISAVGTVGGGGVSRLADHYARALELFRTTSGLEIAGFIPSEIGPGAVTYGWRESAATGLPVVDAPCNGRAHPTGLMGSLGLHRLAEYETVMAAVGGDRRAGTYAELAVSGNLRQAAALVREAAARNGGAVAVVRNPVSVAYARQHAAVGALAQALRIGDVLRQQRGRDLETVLHALAAATGGRVLGMGTVQVAERCERAGYTIGRITIASGAAVLDVPVCNEYMMASEDGVPLAVFPDLIAIFAATTALPLGTADVQPGQTVGVFSIPAARLVLSSAMADRALLEPVESMLGVSLPKVRVA